MTNGLVQFIRMDRSTRQIRVKVAFFWYHVTTVIYPSAWSIQRLACQKPTCGFHCDKGIGCFTYNTTLNQQFVFKIHCWDAYDSDDTEYFTLHLDYNRAPTFTNLPSKFPSYAQLVCYAVLYIYCPFVRVIWRHITVTQGQQLFYYIEKQNKNSFLNSAEKNNWSTPPSFHLQSNYIHNRCFCSQKKRKSDSDQSLWLPKDPNKILLDVQKAKYLISRLWISD